MLSMTHGYSSRYWESDSVVQQIESPQNHALYPTKDGCGEKEEEGKEDERDEKG